MKLYYITDWGKIRYIYINKDKADVRFNEILKYEDIGFGGLRWEFKETETED